MGLESLLSLLRNTGLDLAFFFPDWKAVTYDFVLLFLHFFPSFYLFIYFCPPGGGAGGAGDGHQLGEYYLNIRNPFISSTS